ncbi:fumarylacetoacetate hydrolase family protein [Gracilibacillus kekensis]|uniref:2-keto-4-pentenoate hydratase/2-oxohepta-3-ene-1,7-dioic acid hydratase (Catechol pathway) n=1 Tax=Gracilibacillus kekensis TaxID=1027249 RepID=A0A1M7KYF8_9BACI|nr:fumarylacetoacetate hydrolase family protein [Gracilibacillus kekensis]SHM70525.1 2-keto-4-pentenoate hydratase/2-oxohepta-3-ene-1,7-dioic acid hydratase (catechol pathway) [Gracilibacillus kekensis]
MKLVNYRLKYPFAQNRIGILKGEKIVDVHKVHEFVANHIDSNEAGTLLPADPNEFYLNANANIMTLERLFSRLQNPPEHISFQRTEVILETPIPNPSKIICIGTNYADHVKEMGGDLPEYPVLFSKFNNALIGPEDDIHKSTVTEKLDYEVELTVVIGKKAAKVKKENALDYIAGYTIGNDISARDLQKRTPQWLQGKSLDHTTPVGPWLVTTSEISDPSHLRVRSYVNGEQRQSSNTEQLIFDIPFLIEFISNIMALEPGDMILTGTPGGVGFAMNPPALLNDGDQVTLEIEKIGTLENKVVNV